MDYASLRAQISTLKEKFVRNKKVLKRLTNEYIQNGKRYERRYKHPYNTSIRLSTKTTKKKGNLYSTNAMSANREAPINEAVFNKADKENTVIATNNDSYDDLGETNNPVIRLKH